jgi:hypothetical protein
MVTSDVRSKLLLIADGGITVIGAVPDSHHS